MKPTTKTTEWTKNKLVMEQEIELNNTDPGITRIFCVPVIVLLFKSVYFKKK